jgi:hypothetical protein
VKKLLSAGVLSLALLAGSAFAYRGQYRNRDWDEDHHRYTRHARVVRVVPSWDQRRRHVRIVRLNNGRRLVVVRNPRRAHYVYYDRHYRMP